MSMHNTHAALARKKKPDSVDAESGRNKKLTSKIESFQIRDENYSIYSCFKKEKIDFFAKKGGF